MSLNDYDKLKVVYVDVNDIKPAPFNPPSRSNAQSIESLEREIKDAGAVLVPLALTRNGELADGHGRLLIAKRLGFKTVPCIYYPTDNAKALYSRLNSATRPMQSRTWKEAHRHGLDEEYLPPRQRSQIAGLRRILPIDEFNQFMTTRHSSNILVAAYRVAHYCGDVSDPFVREILLWIMEYNQFSLLRKAIMQNTLTPDQVIEIILMKRHLIASFIPQPIEVEKV